MKAFSWVSDGYKIIVGMKNNYLNSVTIISAVNIQSGRRAKIDFTDKLMALQCLEELPLSEEEFEYHVTRGGVK